MAGSQDRYFKLALFIMVLLCLVRVFAQELGPDAVFGPADNDDVMRLLSVRSWLAGQSWFDMTQYGVLPPDGVSLHWTRYIDVGLGGLVALFSLFLPMTQAELWAVIAWPTLLLVVLISIVGFGVRRLISPTAAIVAMLIVFMWMPISFGYFRPGRVDHHNVQILLLTIATIAAFWPTSPIRSGITVGLAAALSVTTGLETVFFLVGLGLLLVVRAAMNLEHARTKLTAFSLSIATGVLVAHVGQTAPSLWLHPACDKLSLPYILVVWIGAVAALSIWVIPERYRTPIPVLGVIGGFCALGVFAALPILSPCLADPYSNLPQDVQDFISRNLIEALPLSVFAERYSGGALKLFHLPIASITLAVILYLNVDRSSKTETSRTVGLLLCLAAIGVMASLLQVRQVVLLAPVVPLLAGYALVRPFELRAQGNTSIGGVTLLLALVLFALPIAFGETLIKRFQDDPNAVAETESADNNCALPSLMAELNALPAGAVLSPLNLGPKLVAFSHHTALSAPYHRSADALSNGFLPFKADANGLIDWARDTSADYLVLCEDTDYGDGAATQLAAGSSLVGLEPTGVDAAPLLVFMVQRP